MSQNSPVLKEIKIVAIGAGNSGSNIINYMMNDKQSSVKFIISNTHTYENLRETIGSADIVFVVAGFGGTTGFAHSIFVARLAKVIGALTIGVVSTPFAFEGSDRFNLAEGGIEILKTVADSVVVIPNDKLLSSMDDEWLFPKAFQFVDGIFERVINAISGAIRSSGDNPFNLVSKDLQTILIDNGLAGLGIGEYKADTKS